MTTAEFTRLCGVVVYGMHRMRPGLREKIEKQAGGVAKDGTNDRAYRSLYLEQVNRMKEEVRIHPNPRASRFSRAKQQPLSGSFYSLLSA